VSDPKDCACEPCPLLEQLQERVTALEQRSDRTELRQEEREKKRDQVLERIDKTLAAIARALGFEEQTAEVEGPTSG